MIQCSEILRLQHIVTITNIYIVSLNATTCRLYTSLSAAAATSSFTFSCCCLTVESTLHVGNRLVNSGGSRVAWTKYTSGAALPSFLAKHTQRNKCRFRYLKEFHLHCFTNKMYWCIYYDQNNVSAIRILAMYKFCIRLFRDIFELK